jgi:hypothetical protein
MGGRSDGVVADLLLRRGLLYLSLLAVGCNPLPPTPPPTFTLTEFQPDSGRGGRTVAVSISSADPQIAIAAAESGGLFQTRDGGQSWAHLDAFPPFRMSDVLFAPPGFGNSNVVIATALADATANAQAKLGRAATPAPPGRTSPFLLSAGLLSATRTASRIWGRPWSSLRQTVGFWSTAAWVAPTGHSRATGESCMGQHRFR